jgi:hypothetical protein
MYQQHQQYEKSSVRLLASPMEGLPKEKKKKKKKKKKKNLFWKKSPPIATQMAQKENRTRRLNDRVGSECFERQRNVGEIASEAAGHLHCILIERGNAHSFKLNSEIKNE